MSSSQQIQENKQAKSKAEDNWRLAGVIDWWRLIGLDCWWVMGRRPLYRGRSPIQLISSISFSSALLSSLSCPGEEQTLNLFKFLFQLVAAVDWRTSGASETINEANSQLGWLGAANTFLHFIHQICEWNWREMLFVKWAALSSLKMKSLVWLRHVIPQQVALAASGP